MERMRDYFGRFTGNKAASPAASPYHVLGTPAQIDPSHLVEEDDEPRPLRERINVRVVGAIGAAGIVALIVILAATLSGGGDSSSDQGQNGALADGSSIVNNFDSVWKCKNGETGWSAAACDTGSLTCDESTRQITCCLPESPEEECLETDLNRCDISKPPTGCGSGFTWFCQKPNTEEAIPVFTQSFCSLPTSCDTTRNTRCCAASDFLCLEDKQGQCDESVRPAPCDGSSDASTGTSTTTDGATVDTTTSTTSTSSEETVANVTSSDSISESITASSSNTTSKKDEVSPTPAARIVPMQAPSPAPTQKPTSAPTRASPPPPPPPAPSTNWGEGITVINNCGPNTMVYYGGLGGARVSDIKAVPEQCSSGRYCPASTMISGESKAFWISTPGHPGQNQAARTLVEVNVQDGLYWYDVSKVKGYNYGAKIEHRKVGGASAGTHAVVCTHVNCKDAYYLCDTAYKNIYNPDYRGDVAGHSMTITFCPGGPDSYPPGPYPGDKRVQGPGTSAPYFCDCDGGAWIPASQQIPKVGTIINRGSPQCGPVTHGSQ